MPTAAFRADRPILLVGLMGSGKSTVGPRLAERLGLPFVDSDREIERAEGMPVASIFDRLGEDHFRRREREILAALVTEPQQVIAAGGGALIDEPSRRALLAACTCVWLDAAPAVLAARLADCRNRPLLRGRDVESTLREQAKHRNPAYAEAHLRIAVNDLAPDQVVDEIVSRLSPD